MRVTKSNATIGLVLSQWRRVFLSYFYAITSTHPSVNMLGVLFIVQVRTVSPNNNNVIFIEILLGKDVKFSVTYNSSSIYIASVFCMTEIIVIVTIETIGYYS